MPTARPQAAPQRRNLDFERLTIGQAPRNRYLRTFVKWFFANHDRFLLPVQIARVRRDHIELAISGFAGCIGVNISGRRKTGDFGANVSATWEGIWMDLLWDNDLSLIRVAGGYACSQCLPDFIETYPTREWLWIGHTFEALMTFVNSKLAAAEYLNFHAFGNGSTSASLSATSEADVASCIVSVALGRGPKGG